ncbi:Glycosyltransferase family 52 [Enterobacteriaceae bacterium strain FGI 57]|nr:Glycosyltransferase family 52 [Enterobacteriaceae bacterium strain FGI 57]
MNLVICFTPLQILIAKKVIKEETIEYDDIEFVYFSKTYDDKQSKYYELISVHAKKSTFITGVYSFKLIQELKAKFKGRSYDKVLLASLDDSINHYLLSFCDFNQLITFDDGVGNIIKTGAYFIEDSRRSLKKRFFTLVHILLGRKYYLNLIKQRSDRHYTIYKGFENCVPNAKAISLFDFHLSPKTFNNVTHVFLGTMFNEITIQQHEGDYLKKELLSYMLGIQGSVKYIPHPRSRDREFTPYEFESNGIAEEIVFELLSHGYVVNLYGFASSCQFNLMNIRGVNIILLDSPRVNMAVKEAINMLLEKIPSSNYINIQS